MRIGDIDIGPGALLAPMEAVTDLPFRTLCEEHGAALTYTEFLSAEALTRGVAKATARLWASLGGRRFAVQVFGREPEVVADAASMAVDIGACLVDINMGCPARRVTAGLCGAALMREPDLAARIVSAVRAALPSGVPVTVKQRAGWDDRSPNAAEFARKMVEAGAALVTVHGRTRDQGFSGSVRLAPIAEVRALLPRHVPVVGNGDVKTVADYLAMKRATGCDAVMIGRAARGNPWLFRDVLAVERGQPAPRPPTVAERRAVWRRHADLVAEYAAPKMLLHELRKTLAWYSHGLFGGAFLRRRSFAEPDPDAVLALGEAYFARLSEREARCGADLGEPAAAPRAKWLDKHARRRSVRQGGTETCEG
ncbi:MAG: tRNA-dihydrouridine synthase [Deltaproteobacteria bacterium]|nr:tRNA-dihydrouridine synthase [Deltaproteobacteria bacterium]